MLALWSGGISGKLEYISQRIERAAPNTPASITNDLLLPSTAIAKNKEITMVKNFNQTSVS